jgi:hypothetical protein
MEQISNFVCPDKWFKSEALFTTWFWWQIQKWGWFFYKISDESRWLKPFDWLISYNWLVAAVELKYTKYGSCFPFQMLRWSSSKNPWSQVKSLTDWQKNGWKSLVIVYSAKKNMYVVLDFAGLAFTSHITF